MSAGAGITAEIPSNTNDATDQVIRHKRRHKHKRAVYGNPRILCVGGQLNHNNPSSENYYTSADGNSIRRNNIARNKTESRRAKINK